LLNINKIIRVLRSTTGAEIAEAALVLPLVFMFLFGIIWFGRAFNIYSTIQQAAQQGAVTAARATCATCGVNGPTFPLPATIATKVVAVMQASSVDPAQIINPGTPPTGCTAPSKITICQQVLLNPSSNPTQIQSCGSPPAPSPSQICGALVTFQYPFTLNFPGTSLNMRQIIMTAQAQSRMEN
jgi:Flp pilus assembly protein TadG